MSCNQSWFRQLRRLSLCLDAFEITRMHKERVARLEQKKRLEQQLSQNEKRRKTEKTPGT